MAARPKLQIPRSKTGTALNAICALILAGMLAFTCFSYVRLPEIIPVHFGLSGAPDGYAGKGSIFILPAVSAILFALITVLSRFPHIFNYPVEINAGNAPFQYRNARLMLGFLKTEMLLMFTFIEWDMARSAANGASGTGAEIFVFIGAILATLVVFIARMAKNGG